MIIYGKINLGRVDEVANICVMTNFFMLFFVPLIPLQSYYAISHSRFTDASPVMLYKGLCGKSVLIAYIRALTLLAVLAVAVIAVVESGHYGKPLHFTKSGQYTLLVLTGVAAALVGLATYAFERPHDRDAQKVREVAARVLGMAIDPCMVPHDVVKTLREKMDEELRARGFSTAEDVVENRDADCRANEVALVSLWSDGSPEGKRLCQVLLARLRESDPAAEFVR